MATHQDTIDDLLPSFRRHLVAKNRSKQTITKYSNAANTFAEYLAKVGHPGALVDVAPADIESTRSQRSTKSF